MGHKLAAECLDCGHQFEIEEGGGFFFHLLRCNQCGKTKSIRFNQIPDLHKQYLKGLGGCYCIASKESDGKVQADPSIVPITEKTYYQEIEKRVGKCECKGSFRFDAKPRCPKCKSVRIQKGETTLFYD
jgi:Zn finger protein HypA/HybF involved in hydrogenase expression